MRNEGLGGRKKKVTEEVLEEMRSLRGAELSKKEIAEKLGLSYETVFRYLKEEGFFERLKRKMGPGINLNLMFSPFFQEPLDLSDYPGHLRQRVN